MDPNDRIVAFVISLCCFILLFADIAIVGKGMLFFLGVITAVALYADYTVYKNRR